MYVVCDESKNNAKILEGRLHHPQGTSLEYMMKVILIVVGVGVGSHNPETCQQNESYTYYEIGGIFVFFDVVFQIAKNQCQYE